ncbi:MAG: hypothetical protein E7486_05945 [Ruminococcaceae bacterium]|nr:hypothetical protein [Oscillospiraceae bacterium]
MEQIKKKAEWFGSEEGVGFFLSCETPEEKIRFLASYIYALRQDKKPESDSGNIFKLAILLGDGVLSSGLPYAELPQFLDPEENPFLALCRELPKINNNAHLYLATLAVLHQKADAFDSNEWIYQLEDKQFPVDDVMEERGFLIGLSRENPEHYQTNPELAFLQLQIIWLFGTSYKSMGGKQ